MAAPWCRFVSSKSRLVPEICDPAVTRRVSKSALTPGIRDRLALTTSRHLRRHVDAKHANMDSGGQHEAASWDLRPDLDLGRPRRRLRSMGPRGSVAIGHPADFVGGHGLVARLAHASKARALRRMCLRIRHGIRRSLDTCTGPITGHMQTTVLPNR